MAKNQTRDRGPARSAGGGAALLSHDCDVMEQIAELVVHREGLERTIGAAIAHAREEHGVSWAQVGRVVGLTKQGAQKRYGSPLGGTK